MVHTVCGYPSTLRVTLPDLFFLAKAVRDAACRSARPL